MAERAEDGTFLLLISYSTFGDEWEELERGYSIEEVEALVQDIPKAAKHYVIASVEDGGSPPVGEGEGEYEEY